MDDKIQKELKEVQKKLSGSVPFPSRLGEPEEFADLVVHIIENNMFNTQNLIMNGKWYTRIFYQGNDSIYNFSNSKNTIYEAFIKGYSKSTGIDPKTKKSLKGLEGGLY